MGIPSHGPNCITKTHPARCRRCGLLVFSFSCDHGSNLLLDSLDGFVQHDCGYEAEKSSPDSRSRTNAEIYIIDCHGKQERLAVYHRVARRLADLGILDGLPANCGEGRWALRFLSGLDSSTRTRKNAFLEHLVEKGIEVTRL